MNIRTILGNLTPARMLVFGITISYTIAAGVYFSAIGNTEFLGYIAGIVFLVLLGGCLLTHECVPVWLLWMLSFLGVLHLLGAAVQIDGDVLYSYVPLLIENPTGLTFIKYDQIVHTYGSFVGALLMYFFLVRDTKFHWFGIFVFAVLGSIGLGALNEIVEFIAKLTVSDTDVGGYYNTAVDLCVNLFGAVLGAIAAFTFWKRPSA
ncbi:DUF2238 domain-containing protein [Patescibacteria group bacterium]|nr:DUF2238 domain-containing protein [Patescibacteria group bacterium]MBU2220802.1 DUF2238 domain-containing protein [Patescibacteria group bacterium]